VHGYRDGPGVEVITMRVQWSIPMARKRVTDDRALNDPRSLATTRARTRRANADARADCRRNSERT
jgi:hypothetical protein